MQICTRVLNPRSIIAHVYLSPLLENCCFVRKRYVARMTVFLVYYHATAKYTHGIAVEILSVRPSVRLSVKRVHCDKTKAPSEKSSIMGSRPGAFQ